MGTLGRSREGAWIEMLIVYHKKQIITVAPVRERGLKSGDGVPLKKNLPVAPVRERGLKLEKRYMSVDLRSVAPVRERGLKWQGNYFCKKVRYGRSREGAWIEISDFLSAFTHMLASLP